MSEHSNADRRNDPIEDPAEWPYTTLLLFGYFGQNTPAGKRLSRRTNAFMALFVVCMFTSGARDGYHALPDLLWVLGIPASVIGIWWAYSRYLRSLDELSQMLQLKAFAFGYGAAMTLMAVGLAVAWIAPTPRAPRELLVLPVFAEVFRGLALAHLARQYR